MSLRDEFNEFESAPGAAPLGWRLSMGLCNLLIAASVLGFVLFTAFGMTLLELF